MKKLLLTLPLLLVAAPFAEAADAPVVDAPAPNVPTVKPAMTYEQIFAIAQEELERATRAFAAQNSWESQLATMRAADAFRSAAKVAPDDAKKWQALSKAGEHFSQFSHSTAAEVYEEALQIVSLSPLVKAEVLWLRAKSRAATLSKKERQASDRARFRALYEEAFQVPEATAEQRRRAKYEVAKLWYEDDDLLNALLEYEKASLVAGLNKYEQNSVLYAAVVDAKEWKGNKSYPEILAVLERIMPRHVELRTGKPQNIAARFNQAELLGKYGAPTRAYAIWEELADDATASITERVRAVAGIAAQRLADKQPALAIQAWERVASWPKTQDGAGRLTYQRALSLANIYEATGDETKLRDELTTLLASPDVRKYEKANLHYRVGASHLREVAKWKASSTRPDAATKTKIADAEKLAVAAFNLVATDAGQGYALRYKAATQISQIELEQKRYPQARAVLQTLLDDHLSAPGYFAAREYAFPLAKDIAAIFETEKLYGDAAAVLGVSIKAQDVGYEDVVDEALDLITLLWTQSLKQKSWDEARQILTVLTNLRRNDGEIRRHRLQLEVAMQDWKVAANTFLLAQDYMSTMKEEDKKIINDLGAQLPADVLEQARKDAAKAKASAG